MDSSRSINHPLKTIGNAPSSRSDISPLDFSFRRLKHVTDIVDDEQDSMTLDDDPEDVLKSQENNNSTSMTNHTTEGTGMAKGDFIQRVKRNKSRSKCLRLNNNSLITVDGLPDIVSSLFLHPLSLSWLDLSFNRLAEISAIFCDLPHLQILYLHGNCIKVLSQVENLRPATHLKKLTLHGNPIENVKNYRNTLLITIPTLNEFDFSCVVKSDRESAEVWRKNHQSLVDRKKKRKKAHLEKTVS